MVKCKGGHKLTPDPDNEPDLDVISQQWPVLPAAAAPTEQSVAAPKSNDDSTNLAESKRPASASVDDDPTTVVVTEDPSGSVLIDLTMSPVSVIPQANTVSAQKAAEASSDVTKLAENIVSPTPRDQPKNELSVASTSNNRLVSLKLWVSKSWHP
jgi:hypothetical protein